MYDMDWVAIGFSLSLVATPIMPKYFLLICLFFVIGCKPFTTTSVLSGLGLLSAGVVGINKYTDYKLSNRSLDLKEREIILKEKIFAESKVK